MYNRIYKEKTILILMLLIIAFAMGITFEVIEFLSGRLFRYSFEVMEVFHFIDDGKLTQEYFWELDYFRICVHTGFVTSFVSLFSFSVKYYKFKTFEYSYVFPIMLFIISLALLPFSCLYLLYSIIDYYIFSFSIFLTSFISIVCYLILAIILIIYKKKYRNYDFNLKVIFNKENNTLGIFRYKDYEGVIIYNPSLSDTYFEEKEGKYYIFIEDLNIKKCEKSFLFKLSYWRYYLDKVIIRINNKELYYHDNAINYANEFVNNYFKIKK